MLNQIGYAIGMFFILPLGDIKEKRSLIILMLCLSAVSLALMSISQNVYAIAVGLILLLAIVLWILFPHSPSTSNIACSKLLRSLWDLLRSEPVLRQSSLSGAMMFAAFSAFWTTLIFLLESPTYKLGAQAHTDYSSALFCFILYLFLGPRTKIMGFNTWSYFA